MNANQIKVMLKFIVIALPLLVLYGYLLAIIYQQWWLKQFGIPADFIYLSANTLLIASQCLLILLGVLAMCYYALAPLLNRENIFRKSRDRANFLHALTFGFALAVSAAYVTIGYMNSHFTTEQFSWGFIGGLAGLMILLTTAIVQWGLASRTNKNKWYAKPYLYFEKRPMTPLIFFSIFFLVGSYLVAVQLAIKNWQAYVQEPNYVIVDGTTENILIGVFGDKVGVVQESEFGIEGNTTKFVDIERITFKPTR